MTKNTFKDAVRIVIGAVLLSIGIAYASTWTGPTANFPAGNVDPPINISGTAQTKTGGFTTNGALGAASLSVSGGGYFGGVLQIVGGAGSSNPPAAGKVLTSLDTSGTAAWKTLASVSGITSLSPGTAIILSPNPITNTGTISVDTNAIQSKVTGTCSNGQAITSITTTGGVTCSSAMPSTVPAPDCISTGMSALCDDLCPLHYSPINPYNCTGYCTSITSTDGRYGIRGTCNGVGMANCTVHVYNLYCFYNP